MLLNIDDLEEIERAADDIETEEFLMGDGRPQPQNTDPQLDEELWNAWVKKNEAKDQTRFAGRKKITVILFVFGIVLLLVWRLTR